MFRLGCLGGWVLLCFGVIYVLFVCFAVFGIWLLGCGFAIFGCVDDLVGWGWSVLFVFVVLGLLFRLLCDCLGCLRL